MNRTEWRTAFRTFARSLPDALLLLDGRSTVLDANPPAVRLLGGSRDALVGRSLLELAGPESSAPEHWKRWRTTRDFTPGALRLPGPDGDERRFRCDGGLVLPPGAAESGDGRLVLLRVRRRSTASERFGLLTERIDRLNAEILRRRKAEEELQRLLEAEKRARRAAAEANRLKDEFLASLSHELRTPLNVIMGWVDILQDRGADPELLERGLPAMAKAVKEETQLVEDLLDVQRIVSGQLRLELEEIEVGQVVRDVVAGFRGAAEAKEVELEVEVDRSLPPLQADRSRIRQIVWNLVSNAVKFTSRGDEIHVAAHRTDSGIELQVTDTGIGIPPDMLPHVFDHFRQESGLPRETHGGVGLGLAIVRHLTELHGGAVRAASDGEDQGATFTVRLPVPRPEPDEHPGQGDGAGAGANAGNG